MEGDFLQATPSTTDGNPPYPLYERGEPNIQIRCLLPKRGEGRKALHHLKQTSSSLTATNTHGHYHVLGAATLAFNQGMAGETGAGHAIGMAHGNGAAIDVELLHGDAETITAVDHLRSKGFVQFPQVDV